MENIFHHIKAVLLANPLTNTDDYYAKVISERSLNIADISRSAVTRGQAVATAESMTTHVELFLKEMEYLLKDGFSVNTGYFTATPQIRGVFNHSDEQFDQQKHTIYFQFGQGKILSKGLSEVAVTITGAGNSGTVITRVIDMKTKSENGSVTPNHTLEIQGKKIKIAGNNASVGVYFTNEVTAERYKVDNAGVIVNSHSKVIILIPALETGNYTMEITTQYSNGKLLNAPRTAVWERTLVVA